MQVKSATNVQTICDIVTKLSQSKEMFSEVVRLLIFCVYMYTNTSMAE